MAYNHNLFPFTKRVIWSVNTPFNIFNAYFAAKVRVLHETTLTISLLPKRAAVPPPLYFACKTANAFAAHFTNA
jgi:hypothetical protein